MTLRERLGETGVLLFGDDWQRPLARALGPLHPSPREDGIDDRLMRRWWAEERSIPDWVKAALPTLLRQEAARRREDAARLEQAAARMSEPLAS